MQVVDTNRSKASFTRLNNKRLKEQERKRKATNKKETKRSIEGQHFESDFVQLSGCNPKGLNPRSAKPKGRNGSKTLPVVMTERSHLFPYRTQQLSSPVPKVLGWTRPGRIGRCRFPLKHLAQRCFFLFHSPMVCPNKPQPLRRGASEKNVCQCALKCVIIVRTPPTRSRNG